MRILAALSCACALVASQAFADSAPAQSPPSKWMLGPDESSAILLANLSDSDLTYIYRICQGDGPATRISMQVVSGQPVVLAAGACIDVATRGSVRLTRADPSITNPSSGTFQFIAAVETSGAAGRNS